MAHQPTWRPSEAVNEVLTPRDADRTDSEAASSNARAVRDVAAAIAAILRAARRESTQVPVTRCARAGPMTPRMSDDELARLACPRRDSVATRGRWRDAGHAKAGIPRESPGGSARSRHALSARSRHNVAIR